MLDIPWSPTVRQLRQFGAICLIASLAFGWIWKISWGMWGAVIALGCAIFIASLVAPKILRPVFLGAVMVTIPIGWVLGEVALLVIFAGIFLPIGIVFRGLGRDALNLSPRKNAESYWRTKRNPKDSTSYFRQF